MVWGGPTQPPLGMHTQALILPPVQRTSQSHCEDFPVSRATGAGITGGFDGWVWPAEHRDTNEGFGQQSAWAALERGQEDGGPLRISICLEAVLVPPPEHSRD